jgi:hypothetical protein
MYLKASKVDPFQHWLFDITVRVIPPPLSLVFMVKLKNENIAESENQHPINTLLIILSFFNIDELPPFVKDKFKFLKSFHLNCHGKLRDFPKKMGTPRSTKL